jgi:Xaa-Pro aminopeptidase
VGGLDHRVDRLLGALRKRRMDAYLCVRLSNIRYLTGFTGSNAVLVVRRFAERK